MQKANSVCFCVLLGVTLLAAQRSVAAPGDILGTLNLGICDAFPSGVGFDGQLVYYTLAFDPDPLRSIVHRIDPKTSIIQSNLVVKRGGVPLGGGVGGVEYDPNRQRLWVGDGQRIYKVSTVTGEIEAEVRTADTFGVYGLAYNPWTDMLWESDETENDFQIWCLDPPVGGYCGGTGLDVPSNGLAFDGVDLWHSTNGTLLPPAPAVSGVLYPTNWDGLPDYSRVIDIPGRDYSGIAFDCTTFPVPVLWTGKKSACELVAFEIPSLSTCQPLPSTTVIRSSMTDLDPMKRSALLPLVTATSHRAWRVNRPALVRDDYNAILIDPGRPLAFYRMLGDQDADMGNVLKLVKDAPLNAVIVME